MHWLDEILAEGGDAVRLRADLEYFAQRCLKLRTKTGEITPFLFNDAQRKLHETIEQQRAATGKVRAIVLKSRQLGVSSYVAARFFHRVIFNPGLRCIVIGHERQASRNLFGIIRRFYDHMPADMRPPLDVSNQDELVFSKLDSGYLVSVASSEGTGRSATAQLLHASEVAFWDDLPTQMAGLMQTVPKIADTEVILESTPRGWNSFHGLWRKAESGEGEFAPVYLPWFIDPAYRQQVNTSVHLDEEEQKLAELYGLDDEQLAWRRAKIAELDSPDLFKQEYSSCASEAFVSPTHDSFISPELVMRARREEVEEFGPLLLGIDPAHMGADRTSIAWRRGHRIIKIESRRNLTTMEVAGWVARIIEDEKPLRAYIDVGGLGIGVYDRLIEQGHRCVVNVNFGSKAVEPPPFDETGRQTGGCANRRSEMWLALKKVLEAGRFQLPDSDSLQADLTSVGYRYNSSGQLLLESKQDLRKRGVPSPDEADAVALTFADPSGFPKSKKFNRDLREKYKGAYV